MTDDYLSGAALIRALQGGRDAEQMSGDAGELRGVPAGLLESSACVPQNMLEAMSGEAREANIASSLPALVRDASREAHRERGASAQGARGRWFITPHAVQRYRQRCPGAGLLTYAQALERLIDESERAHYVKDRRNPEEQLWRGGKPHRLRFVVSTRSEGGKPVLVTVLRGCDAGVR